MRPRLPRTLDDFLRPGGPPRIIAHRGLSGLAPENTLPAFAKAVELGVDMIELDVLASAEGGLVVIHDAELERTTDGRGEVARHTLEELATLDAGSWFSPDFAGVRIPTLDEVFDLLGGKVLVDVEIKTEAVSDTAGGGIVERVLALIRARRLDREVLVSSFDERALHLARRLAPDIRRGALYDVDSRATRDPLELVRRTGAAALFLGSGQLTTSLLERAHAEGGVVGVYTVNETERMSQLLDRGVDALFTDRADLMLDLVKRRERSGRA